MKELNFSFLATLAPDSVVRMGYQELRQTILRIMKSP